MKTSMIALGIVMASVSLAHADCMGVPASVVTVKGDSALNLMKALEGVGAQPRVMVDMATLEVDTVRVIAGFLPPRGSFAQFSATQEVFGPRGTHFIRLVNLNMTGDRAGAVFNALEKAGAPVNRSVEVSTISANQITCRAGMVPNGPVCQITIAE